MKKVTTNAIKFKTNTDIYDESNRKSVNFFIKKMFTKTFFLKSDYKLALKVNEEILRLKIKSI